MNAPARRTVSALKKATNISLNADLIAEAKALGINISQACERGLAAELAEVRSARWRAENAKAISTWNDFVEQDGLPLARYRQF